MDVRRVSGFVVMALGIFGIVAVGATLLDRAAGLGASPGGVKWPQALQLLGFAVFGLGVPLAFVLIGRRLAFPSVRKETTAPPRARPPPMPVPAPEDVADLPKPVTACPDCGFLGIRMPQVADGLWPGGGELGDRKVCPRCGWQGLAVSFQTGEAYRAFLQDLAAGRNAGA
ncbi:MAG TPA: hypothetical protein VHH36_03740 [Candidatus Thermoplasmatota archaeon]|nr:hypothetical protein [Candidatus Thermoplasmatota archaeon]